jgi:DNA-binding transcriptional ArsR family regulator
MIELELSARDVASVRFAISPLQEAVASLWVLRHPERHLVHGRWVRQVERRGGPGARLVEALVSPRGFIPDFMTPPPPGPDPRIEDELALVRRSAPDRIRHDVAAAYGASPLPGALRGIDREPQAVVERLVDAVYDYWARHLAPAWPAMREVLRADVEHRAREAAAGGTGMVLLTLHPKVHWDGGALYVDVGAVASERRPATGRGLPLVPSVFAAAPLAMLDPGSPPLLVYPARGLAAMRRRRPDPGPEALARLVGRRRASVLAAVQPPASPTQIATRLGVSQSAVSQQLAVLAAAGLVWRRRTGNVVRYGLTRLGAGVWAAATGRRADG